MGESISKNNKGYSLIEMIIVIAIIAVASAMSITSVTIINAARAKDAAIKFDAEVSELIQKNKNMAPDITGTTDINLTVLQSHPDTWQGKIDTASYGLVLYEDNGNYKISQVSLWRYGYAYGNYFYTFEDDGGSPRTFDTTEISKRVDIEFTGTNKNFVNGNVATLTNYKPDFAIGSQNSVCILFDKKGNCISGYGEYHFKRANGNTVSRVIIRPNGSHEVK